MLQIGNNYNYLLTAISNKKIIVEVHVVASDTQSAITKFTKHNLYKDDDWKVVSVEAINTVDII